MAEATTRGSHVMMDNLARNQAEQVAALLREAYDRGKKAGRLDRPRERR